ncbi:MAG: hypothetical protein IJ218_06150 [Alphaproteobacteria bacterium]|nr:hypothetical protein [Alphaproteobacteria bacterium]
MNKYLKQSIILHIAVFVAIWIDMPDFWHHDMTLGQNPIIVDLSQVRIDELTNLPTKAEFGPEDQKATVTEHKEQYTSESETKSEPEPVKDEPKNEPIEDTKEDFVAPPEPEKKPEPKPEKKPEPKPTPKKPPVPNAKPKPKQESKPEQKKTEPKPQDNKQKQEEERKVRSNALKSLMNEIDNDKNIDLGAQNQKAMIKEGTPVNNMGIEGGNSQGSYFSDLTISETDAIASLLRQNWNLDPGAMGIDNMRVEIRVSMKRDGSIDSIDFVDKNRYNTDPNYRSVAESARRAIIQTENAFKQVFGQKYADKYEVWSTLRLYFDPLDKGVH